MLLLHSTRRCPFSIRVRIMLYLKGLEYEVIEEPLRKWTPWMKGWSERNHERPRVPVLRIIDEKGAETTHSESNAINLLLDTTYGETKYTPIVGSKAYDEMQNWCTWCDDILKPQIDLYKYGENLQFDQASHGNNVTILSETLTTLESALKVKQYLIEDHLTIADIAIIPFIRQIMRTREGEFDFTGFPAIKEWTMGMIDTSWFQEIVMIKY